VQAAQGDREGAIDALQELIAEDAGNHEARRILTQMLRDAGRVEEALALVRAALEADPEQVALRPLLSSLYLGLGRIEEAERALRELVDRSETPSAYIPLVDFYAERGNAEQSAEVLAEAIARFPDEVMLRVLHTEALIALERLAEAEDDLELLLEAAPEAPDAEYLRARIELARGDARAASGRLLRLLPRLDRAATQFWLGQALEAQGDYSGAQRRYGLARTRDASWIPPQRALIRLAQRRGDWRAAVVQAARLARREPGSFEWRAALADALINLGEGEPAAELSRELVRAFPDRAEPPLLLARALREQGRNAEALRTLEELSEHFGAAPEIEAERALTLGMSGRTDEGIALARDALASNPGVARLHWALAALLFEVEAAEPGSEAVERALALDPDEPGPLRLRCEFGSATGRLVEAQRDCARYLEARPDDPRAHFLLGLAQAGAGGVDAAIRSYRRAAELDDRDFASRNNLAELLAQQGELDGALAAAQEAYRLASENPYVLDTLGQLYLRKGLVDRSISLLEEANAAAPDLPEHQLHLAQAYREAGRSDDARRVLASAKQGAEDAPELRARIDDALRSLP
jgi:predicted Zn-dependent protease